ncbi:MAG: N-acetyl-1-D-myo-inositol-2-amino-2-deoxy-alpha-D-glucopyranoside deacetylase [Actinomycetes bacterium]
MPADPAATAPTPDRRMVLVHAHPDDETIGTGVTMARYAAEGAQVTLVTCTRGEEGEVLVPSLTHLAAAHDDLLGEHREAELAAAMRELGVDDHRFLGGAGRYRDSGMMGTDSNDSAECFWRADLLEATAYLVEVLREVRPQVLVTYDDFGGYGHPDHIQAHRVAMYGALLAAAPSFRPELGAAWEIQKIYWSALPKSFIQQGIDALVAAGGTGLFGLESADDLPFAVDDDVITTRIDGRAFEPRKIASLRAHETQVEAESEFFTMAEMIGPDAMGVEFFRLVRGPLGHADPDGYEDDLFGGLIPTPSG